MLNIEKMTDEDRLFNFMSGLQAWAQTELRRQDVKDLQTAMAATDAPVDLRAFKATNGAGSKMKDKGKRRDDHKAELRGNYKGKSKAAVAGSSKPKSGDCFICDGLHMAREWLKRERLNALIIDGKHDLENSEVEEVRVSPL